jgi:hypothetical protein
MGLKGTKRSKQEEVEVEEAAPAEEEIVDMGEDTGGSKKIRKRKRKVKEPTEDDTNGDYAEEVAADVNAAEAEEAAPAKRKRSRKAKAEVEEAPVVDEEADKKHTKALNNVLPTRAERGRRENQRKMQKFVSELREQGFDKKAIEKMKKKAKTKMKFIATDVPFSDVVSDMSDMRITCRDCGSEFVFPVKDQVFYKEKGFAPAVRCRECSASKKERMSRYDKPQNKY